MERILTGISEENFKELSSLLEQKTGVALSGHEEVVELHGFAVSYLYNPSLQTMTLKLVKKPCFVPESVVASKLDQYLSGPGAALLHDVSTRS